MRKADLEKLKDIHGCLIAKDHFGYVKTLYGYIREVKDDFIIFQDNCEPDHFKVRNVMSFEPVKIILQSQK